MGEAEEMRDHGGRGTWRGGAEGKEMGCQPVTVDLSRFVILSFLILHRLQELEDQYRKEREEANYLLEQQRLVGTYILLLNWFIRATLVTVKAQTGVESLV